MNRGKGALGIGLDIEQSGNWVVEYQGQNVLNVEPKLAPSLKGITLDVDDTSKGSKLVIVESPP